VAERPALEAVLLDAGGTLVRLDFEWMVETLAGLGVRTDVAAMRDAEVEGRRAYDTSCGPRRQESPPLGAVGDVRAYFGGMIAAAGVPAERVGALVDRFLERERDRGLWSRPAEGARETLDALEGLGLRRAVISNSDGRASEHLRNAGVLRGLEFVVDSHREGVEKPDPRIFRIALERLGVPPERALYVGDILAVDATGARAAAVEFVLIDPAGDYAPEGMAAIAEIGELPRWIVNHYRASGAPPARSLAR
jgi:HAD superfamily hydrolase (TIGR01509 family)